jgi:diguanylate cyclase (GGDEF)-like protein
MPPVLRVALGLTVAIILASLIPTVGIGGEELHVTMRDWAPATVYVLVAAIVVARAIRVPEARTPWTVLAVGLVFYAAGNLLWPLWAQNIPNPPIPSVCDLLWLSLYPASYVGLAQLARGGEDKHVAGVWLDGLIVGLGVATVGAAVVFPPILDAAEGNTAAVVTNLAYPVFDLLLVALVGGIATVYSWRLSRAWWCLGGGFLTLAIGDTIYLQSVAAGSAESSLVANLFYMSGVALIALAAWQPRTAQPLRRIHWSILVVPATCAISAVALLVYGQFAPLGDVAVLLAALTILAALARTALTFRDVRALGETRRLAITDDLTSLPNRRAFVQRADAAVAASLESERSVALLIVDLNHFKELNDTLGHHAGDVLLTAIGPRLLERLEATDTLARLGGDEFGLVLDPSDEAQAVAVAGRVLAALEAPFEISGLQLNVSASVGIALCPLHGRDTTELMQRADIAMYEAKELRSGYQVYEGSPDKYSRENLALISDLPDAVGRSQLELHFQPKVRTDTRRAVGAEALVRWRHPVHGLLAPDRFIPMLDRAGLSRQLTRWVLDTALAECRRWHDGGAPLHVAVNATVPDLLDSGFPGEVAAALDRHELPAEVLIIEITETSVVQDPDRADAILTTLRELGVGVALDDFGTGYSSLTHLKSLPVTEVKIDRSFVSRMSVDSADAAIVGSTIGLAHGLGLSVIAEGVEDEATWQHLADLGCELIQGYHYSKPLPGPAFADLLSLEAAAAVGSGR